MSQYELESRWVTAAGIPGVMFRFSDLVRINSGDYSGQTGEVIALLTIEPVPVYMIEFPNGKSVISSQNDLESAGASAGRTLDLKTRNSPLT